MAQRELIEKIAVFSSGNSLSTEENFYKLQNLLADCEVSTIPRCNHKKETKDQTVIKAKTEYDSNQIAGLFSNELEELRNDPEFSGISIQVEYLKEILAGDKLISKIVQWQ
jgi:hypothetical protein